MRRTRRVAASAVLLLAAAVLVAPPAQAAVSFNVRPISWDVIGLDSNNINDGPNTYEVGARACNTSATDTATTVKATFVWETFGAFAPALGTGVNPTGWPAPAEADNYVHIQTGTDDTEVIHGLAPNACFDFYFNLEVERNVNSYFWTRPYHIIVQNCPGDVCNADPTLDYNVTTPPDRQIYIEKILSQNRNYVASTGKAGSCSICGLYLTAGFTDADGPGGTDPTGTRVAPAPAANLLKVGQEYNFTLVASTATGGYGSWSSQINWPRGIFQILKVKTQLQQYPDPINPTGCCYEDSNPYVWPNPVPPAVPPTNPPSCPSVAATGTFGCNGVIAQTWANAGAFCEVVPVGGNTGCTTPATVFATSGSDVPYRGLDPAAGNKDTAGNLVYISFTLRVVKVGGATTSAVVWDGSGSSYHYNGDYNDGGNFYTFCASNSGTGTGCNTDTAVEFDSARATRVPGGSLLRWTTGSETNNLGFNVYAKKGDRKVKLNAEPVAGSALSNGDSALGAANSYQWFDPGRAPRRYWIEALDLDGTSQWRSVKVRGRSLRAQRRPSSSLSSLSPPDALRGGGTVSRAASLDESGLPGEPSMVASRGVKIGINREGWYRIPLRTLAAEGVNVAKPNRLVLHAEGIEQPMLVRKRAVEFYGLGLDTPQTDTRVYWLSRKASGGAKRIVQLPPSGGATAPAYFMSSVERRDKGLYFPALINGEDSNFFGSVVGASEVTQTLSVEHLAEAGGANLDVALQGVTEGGHSVSVGLNGEPVGTLSFKDRDRGVLSVPAVSLVEGTNTVTLSSPAWADLSLVESVGITYPRSYVSNGGSLRFTVPGGSAFSVTGFAGPRVRIADVTDAAAPVQLAVDTSPDGTGGYAASGTAPGTGERTLYAFRSGASPSSVVPIVPSRSLASSPDTDMLIIAGSDLARSVAPLVKLHRSEGLSTRTIPIDTVYDQFSYGEKDPRALKDFLAYAESHWAKSPRYVLLAGDASLDPRGYLGPKGVTSDVIPTKQVDTHAGEISSDAWFSDLNGDLRPDFALGRLPARSAAEADAMAAKIVSYASGSKNGDLVIAEGAPHADDAFDFSAAAHEAANMTPPGGVGSVVSSDGTDAKASLISAMNAGPSQVGYFGHGNVALWGGGFFGSSDVASLTNTDHPFLFTPWTCYNAYFTDPNLDSLSESLLKADGGAVAAYASSGATEPWAQRELARRLYGELASSSAPVIGDAVVAASAEAPTDSLSAREVLVTWTLLGDPAMGLR